MDPQEVLRMLEMHAHMNDSQGAEAFLHYNVDEIACDTPQVRKGKVGRVPSRRRLQTQNAAA